MKRQMLMILGLAVIGGLFMGAFQEAVAAPELIGAPKCKMCHGSKTGDQYKIWGGSAHAGAFETLGTPEAKKIAEEKGVGDPQKAADCLKCHATQAFLGGDVKVNAKGKYADAEGVGCEACHGAGSDYKSKKVMVDHDAAVAAGMIIPKGAEFCQKCHNETSPTFKAFDYEKQWAAIAHPVPEKK